ncbi:hypothetical protein K437DRAFT_266698 [Tilletiaria anomala UBC 951]|uniref:Uncharacterized protein n=1 Tax=Tilletiaria anomala (strain ATCC 24038 / CBS 436.72 / UBC 951) TaxID=1037660 RepID=A0A066WP27_TILAU|nr:uncharacterized protein K437DRAFT_266698 [Tilletiaria anomala UBC 951]KDN52335.1 hypothetical protein K437DRAFT_266698 [Tilletiaria anomala UBC 951]
MRGSVAFSTSRTAASRPPALRSFYNTPRFIFLSWTALVFSAGFGYYIAKARNTAKAHDFLRKARIEQAQQSGTVSDAELQQIAQQQSQRKVSSNEKSPAQSLAAAFARQKERV